MGTDIPRLSNGSTAPARLLDQVRERLRLKHYSIHTEKSYVDWIRRYILFHDKRHPRDLGATHVERFLTNLAVDRELSASTRNQPGAATFCRSCCRGRRVRCGEDIVRMNPDLRWHRGTGAASAPLHRYRPDARSPSADQGRRFRS